MVTCSRNLVDNPPPVVDGVPNVDQRDVRAQDGRVGIGGDWEHSGDEPDVLFLDDRGPALPRGLYLVRIHVYANDPASTRGEAGRGDATDISESVDADPLHLRIAHDSPIRLTAGAAAMVATVP